MTDSDDPLLGFLAGELVQIAEAVGLERGLPVPVTPLLDSHGQTRTFSWTFRFTWQEVERSRRYVIPLPRERARQAQRAALGEITAWAISQIAADSRVTRDVSSEAALVSALHDQADEAEITTWRSDDGVSIGFVHDPAILALPISEIRRSINYRAGLNVYAISESVSVGALQLLQPESVGIVGLAPDSPE